MRFIPSLLANTFLFMSSITIFTGCGSSGSDTVETKIAYSVVASTEIIDIGDEDCSNGGILLKTGFDDNSNNILDSDEIVEIEKICNGTDGADGATGPAGADGADGADGATGPAGADGTDGTDGATGPAGTDGATGPAGADGADGATGPAGADGADGATGPAGADGADGATGPAGADGTDGATGPAGPAGADGATGPAGADGTDGATGPAGADGADGATGPAGADGATGPAGATALINLITELPGDNCQNGGIKIEVGLDNVVINGILDTNEVDSTGYVCSGNSGFIGWVGAELVETDNTGNASEGQVAIDVNGSAIAVWSHNDGTRTNIMSNHYVNGIGWGTAELIETDNAGNASKPQVAVDANGNAIAVWIQYDGVRSNVMSNRYVNGIGWGTAELIEIDNAGDTYTPQVAVDANGSAIAVWSQHDGVRGNIMSNRYVNGIGWGTVEPIETDNTGGGTVPQVAIDAGGNAIAVWAQGGSVGNNIMSNRYVNGIGWGIAELIETDNTGGAIVPQIAMNKDGSAIAVWSQYDGTRNNIWSNRYVNAIGWATAELIETFDSTNPASTARVPQVDIDENGNAIAVWMQRSTNITYGGVVDKIWSNRYVNGMWGTAELIEMNDGGHAYNPQVAIDTNGNGIAVWSYDDGGRQNIATRRFVDGSGWDEKRLLETDNGSAYSPQIAIDAKGNAIAVWSQSDGTRYNIWANRYKQ